MRLKWLLVLLCAASVCMGQTPGTLSQTERLYGLSKFWMEVEYNFVYFDRIGKTVWDSLYREAIPRVLAAEDDHRYYHELERLCAVLRDGHTNIFSPFEEGNSNFGSCRIGLGNFGGRAIIGAVNYSKKDEIPIGSEIIEVNGTPTREYIAEHVAPFISASTQYIREDLSIERLLRGLDGETFAVKYRTPAGDVRSLTLTHGKVTERETYPPMERPGLMEFKWLENGIAYCALNSFSNPKIDTLFIGILPELRKAAGLIIDLRNNGGGSSYIGTRIFQHLTNDSLLYGARASSRKHIPVFKAWGVLLRPADTLTGNAARGLSRDEVLTCYRASQDRLVHEFEYAPEKNPLPDSRVIVPTVLLIGHKTASAAEDFLIMARNQKHMKTAGTNSFGSTGQPYEFSLPGGGRARICTLKRTYPDGTEFVGVGVRPDIEATQTLEEYLNKKDPVLEKGVEYLKAQLNVPH